MNQSRYTAMAFAAILAAGLTACGGKPNDSDSIPTATVGDFSQWVGSRPSDDGAEPLEVDTVLPPTSETAEPVSLT
jgi:hypothetical protein